MKTRGKYLGELHENKLRRAARVTTEEEFQDVIKNKTGKINLGDCLFIILKAPQDGWFQYRLTYGGKDTTHRLGRYPQMNFTDARREADERTIIKDATTKEKRMKRFKESLKDTTKQKRTLSIESMKELQTIYRQVSENQNIDNESKAVTLLTLIAPIFADSLSSLKISNVVSAYQLEICPFKETINLPVRLLVNSDIIQCIRSNQQTFSEYLFSRIKNLSFKEYTRMIENNLSQSYSAKKIKLSDLEKFFYFVCVEGAGFSEAFINEFKSNFRKGDWAWKHQFQIDTAVNWYSTELLFDVSKFADQFDPLQKQNNPLV